MKEGELVYLTLRDPDPCAKRTLGNAALTEEKPGKHHSSSGIWLASLAKNALRFSRHVSHWPS